MTPTLYQWLINNPTTTTRQRQQATDDEDQEDEEDPEEEDRARCEWDFRLATVVSPPATTAPLSDILGVVELDPSDRLLATGGISRKIRIYTLSTLLPSTQHHDNYTTTSFTDHSSACSFYICTPAKLSSLRWKPQSSGNVIGSGDYDGVVTEHDLDRRTAVFERDEHGGRRVWSVDYSRSYPHLGASSSDDGATHLWDARTTAGCGSIVPGEGGRAPVCSAEFDPTGETPLIGLGCADRRGYVYDLRRADGAPLFVLRGHRRTVTYVRFAGGGGSGRRVVTASVDGCIKQWEVTGSEGREVRTYEGHENSRSFVGLSVWRGGGLIGCGSESNEVYVYDVRWKDPIAVHGFGPSEGGGGGGRREFVSAVCWRQEADGRDECMVVAGGSDGVLQVSVGKRRGRSS